MKNIPIVILNKNRLGPLTMLVESLRTRNYNNIIIIDNNSTYGPLLDWYKTCNIEIFTNNIVRDSPHTFAALAFEAKHPRFTPIVQDYYVFTDPDVVPVEEAPDNFIDDMIEVCAEFKADKVGPSIKIDDLPEWSQVREMAYVCDGDAWTRPIPHHKFELYRGAIDTGFAVHTPNAMPWYSENSIRMGGNHVARHIPYYYDTNNLPEDELYYITHLRPNSGPNVSMRVKEYLMSQGKI